VKQASLDEIQFVAPRCYGYLREVPQFVGRFAKSGHGQAVRRRYGLFHHLFLQPDARVARRELDEVRHRQRAVAAEGVGEQPHFVLCMARQQEPHVELVGLGQRQRLLARRVAQ